jgi:uncharacterized protein (TIGR02145 family)
MSDLLKVKVGRSDYLCKWEKIHSVKIGGRRYRTVIIGNQEWLAENLDYVWNGLSIGGSGTSTDSHAWYYNNNETDYGIDGTYKCGLLYNWYAADYLDNNKATLLPDGWRLPDINDYNILESVVSHDNGGRILKALENSISQGFPSSQWGGTDDYRFSALPTGWRNPDNSSFRQFNEHAHFWLKNVYGSSNAYSWYLHNNYSDINSSIYNLKTAGFSIRLVKDAT